MSDTPINDALEALWEELFEADRYDMREVLLEDAAQAKALHMEMRGNLGIEQRYHFDGDAGRWMWRNMPIITRPEDSACTAYRSAPLGDSTGVAITWEHTPEFIRKNGRDSGRLPSGALASQSVIAHNKSWTSNASNKL